MVTREQSGGSQRMVNKGTRLGLGETGKAVDEKALPEATGLKPIARQGPRPSSQPDKGQNSFGLGYGRCNSRLPASSGPEL